MNGDWKSVADVATYYKLDSRGFETWWKQAIAFSP